MTLARVLTAAAACVLVGAGGVACSGSFGSGPNGPVPLGSLGPNALPTSTATANSSSVVVTYGDNTGFQPLPNVAGYGGAIAFPKAPAPTPQPKSSAVPTAEPIAIGATLSVVKPEDGPDLNFVGGKGKGRRTRELPARALAYLKLLPTHDVTLDGYPRIALDIPRDIAAQYRDGEFGLALWNAGVKDTAYRLAVAERDVASTPPPTARPTAAPSATATPSPTPTPSPSGNPAFRPSPTPFPTPTASPTLPPQRILFAGTATPLKLRANQPAIFAVYALPHPSATAKPSGSPGATATKSAGAAPSASPTAAPASPSPSPKST